MSNFVHSIETTIAIVTFSGVCFVWPLLWAIIAVRWDRSRRDR